MNVWQFEDAVWETDGLRVVIRAPGAAQVQDFDWQNAADQNMSVTEYFRVRLNTRIAPYDAAIISGNGGVAHGRTRIRNVRGSYGGG